MSKVLKNLLNKQISVICLNNMQKIGKLCNVFDDFIEIDIGYENLYISRNAIAEISEYGQSNESSEIIAE